MIGSVLDEAMKTLREKAFATDKESTPPRRWLGACTSTPPGNPNRGNFMIMPRGWSAQIAR
jgi:hypothetical protein